MEASRRRQEIIDASRRNVFIVRLGPDRDDVLDRRDVANGSCRLQTIAFDRWGMNHLKPALLQAGFSESEVKNIFVEQDQGFKSMSPALRDLEALILEKKMTRQSPYAQHVYGEYDHHRRPGWKRKARQKAQFGTD